MKDNLPIVDLIIKSLRNTLQDTEKSAFDEWIAVPENRRLYRRVSAVWSDARMKASSVHPDETVAWRRISAMIGGRTGRRYRAVSAVAAAIAIFLIAGLSMYVISDLSRDRVMADASFGNVAGKTVVTLPDGSEVWLRNGARVNYGNDFGRKTRSVSLSGEAFFDVAKDPSRPFRVSVSGLGVEVLGTSFDIRDCPDRVEVSLVEGTVRLVPGCMDIGGFSGARDGVRVITSGEIASYGKSDGIISVRTGDTAFASLWAHDRISFSDDDIESVCRELSVWYDVKIDIIAETDHAARLSFTVTDEPLEVILSLINKASPEIDYRYLEDGSVQIF